MNHLTSVPYNDKGRGRLSGRGHEVRTTAQLLSTGGTQSQVKRKQNH